MSSGSGPVVRPRMYMFPIINSSRKGREGLVTGDPYPTFRSYVVDTGARAGLTPAETAKIRESLRFSMTHRLGGGGTCLSCSGAV